MSKMTNRAVTILTAVTVVLLLAVPGRAQDAPDADVWRTFASRVDAGSRVTLRLRNGQRVSATLIQAGPDDLVIQPRTRIPVAVQRVPYEAIVRLERDEGRGLGAGKAAAIGVASGVGAFLATFLIVLAVFD